MVGGLSFAFHGNYCGPGWSAGKYQLSVRDPTVPAVDKLDEACMEHDAAYFDGVDLYEADMRFARRTFGRSVKGSIAGLGVGLQGVARKVQDTVVQLPNIPSFDLFGELKKRLSGGSERERVWDPPVGLPTDVGPVGPVPRRKNDESMRVAI